MIRKFCLLLPLLALLIPLDADATTFTTSQSVIDCPAVHDIDGGIGTYGNGDGTEYHISTYLTGSDPYGTPQHIYRQYFDSSGNPGACYDSDPQGYEVYYYSWVRDLSWGQGGSPPYWNGATIWFSSFDGNYFTTSDGGYTWTDTICGGGAYCDAGPDEGQSCFYNMQGQFQVCPAGKYCHDAGYNSSLHKEIGQCVTACTQTHTQGGCGCEMTLLPDPSSGDCPAFYLDTTNGNCVLPSSDSSCIS